MDIDDLKNKLIPVFKKYPQEIVAAYLFGSTVDGTTMPLSDIDIAVLLTAGTKERGHRFKFLLYADLSRKLGRNDIDLVIMSLSGNLILNANIVRHGHVLYSIDNEARQEFEVKVSHLCIDFEMQRQNAMGV